MIIVDVGHDSIVVRMASGSNDQGMPLVLFTNHAAAFQGAPPGIPESVQAAALHVAGVLAAGECGLGREDGHAAG